MKAAKIETLSFPEYTKPISLRHISQYYFPDTLFIIFLDFNIFNEIKDTIQYFELIYLMCVLLISYAI